MRSCCAPPRFSKSISKVILQSSARSQGQTKTSFISVFHTFGKPYKDVFHTSYLRNTFCETTRLHDIFSRSLEETSYLRHVFYTSNGSLGCSGDLSWGGNTKADLRCYKGNHLICFPVWELLANQIARYQGESAIFIRIARMLE